MSSEVVSLTQDTKKEEKWTERRASEHLVSLWRTRCVLKDLQEKAALTALEEPDLRKPKPDIPHPKLSVLLRVAFGKDLSILAGLIMVAVCQVLCVFVSFVSLSLYLDDLTTPTYEGKAAKLNESYIVGIFVSGLLYSVLLFAKTLLVDLGGDRLSARLRETAMHCIGMRPITWFDMRASPSIIDCLGTHISVVVDSFYKSLMYCLSSCANVVCGFIGLATFVPSILGVSLALMPLMAAGLYVYTLARAPLMFEYEKHQRLADAQASQFVTSIRPIRATGTDLAAISTFKSTIQKISFQLTKVAVADATFNMLTVLLSVSCVSILLYHQGTLVEDRKLTTGGVICCLAFTVYTLVYLSELVAHALKLLPGFKAWEPVADVLNLNAMFIPEVSPAALTKIGTIVKRDDDVDYLYEGIPANFETVGKGAICFQKVSFMYPSRPGYPVLRSFLMDIPPGKVVGLMGQRGGGKSTLASLLLRHYTPDTGSITIDGVDIQDYDLSYTRQVGYINSEPMIFNGTVKENIAYGLVLGPKGGDDITDGEIIQAAKFADAHRFIMKLPQSYDTEIGESASVRLSAAQCQRLAIARLFARNPSVCVLDDPLANMDEHAIKPIRTALRRLMQFPVRRTGIVISHQAKDFEFVDIVASLEGGVLVEYGTPEELYRREGSAYSHLLGKLGMYKKSEVVPIMSGTSTPKAGGTATPSTVEPLFEVNEQSIFKHPVAGGRLNQVHPTHMI